MKNYALKQNPRYGLKNHTGELLFGNYLNGMMHAGNFYLYMT